MATVRKYGGMKTRGAGNARRARAAPAESMEVYLSAVTFGKVVQAAAEFEVTVDELIEEAALAILKVKAAELFEREFHEAKMEADQADRPSLKRYEYEKQHRQPAWAKDPKPKPPGPTPE